MIEEQATVVNVSEENITVQTTVKSSCSGCQQLENCGSGQVAKAFGQKKVDYQVACEANVNVGDNVIIGLSEHVLLTAAWQVYIWPLIGLICASLFGQSLLNGFAFYHELYALIFGMIGGYTGFKLAQLKQRKHAQDARWQARLIKIIPANIAIQTIN